MKIHKNEQALSSLVQKIEGLGKIDNDLYQKDIAKILNISQTGYSKYETETNDIPTAILIKLALYYETSTDYILGLTNEKKVLYKQNNILNKK